MEVFIFPKGPMSLNSFCCREWEHEGRFASEMKISSTLLAKAAQFPFPRQNKQDCQKSTPLFTPIIIISFSYYFLLFRSTNQPMVRLSIGETFSAILSPTLCPRPKFSSAWPRGQNIGPRTNILSTLCSSYFLEHHASGSSPKIELVHSVNENRKTWRNRHAWTSLHL